MSARLNVEALCTDDAVQLEAPLPSVCCVMQLLSDEVTVWHQSCVMHMRRPLTSRAFMWQLETLPLITCLLDNVVLMQGVAQQLHSQRRWLTLTRIG